MKNLNQLTIGIDASRNRSGGARAHLVGILSTLVPERHGIHKVHVWAFGSLLNTIPNRPWLFKHNPIALEQTLFKQLAWQATALAGELNSEGCDILFTTDASTLCRFKPMVILSQDMLSYEPGVIRYFGYGFARLRLLVILAVQNLAFQHAKGVIFLTRYAAKVIQQSCGALHSIVCIPHGVHSIFNNTIEIKKLRDGYDGHIRCIYVSNAEMYKHQWVVVEAISKLRKYGFNLTLTLVGGGQGPGQQLLQHAIFIADPAGVFIKQLEFLPHDDLPELLAASDLFVFASSCENMPVTLLEAMAVGLPIACSDRGPMPEVLEDGGVYFDPEAAESIAAAIEKIIIDGELRLRIAIRAKELANLYSWEKCSKETFAFIIQTYKNFIEK